MTLAEAEAVFLKRHRDAVDRIHELVADPAVQNTEWKMLTIAREDEARAAHDLLSFRQTKSALEAKLRT